MDTDLKKLKHLTKFMRSNGVLAIKTTDIEISLSPSALFPEQATTASPVTSSDNQLIPSDAYTQDDILMWSAPGALSAQEAN